MHTFNMFFSVLPLPVPIGVFHCLFPKCRAGTSGYDDYSFAWVCFYGTLFIWLAVEMCIRDRKLGMCPKSSNQFTTSSKVRVSLISNCAEFSSGVSGMA